MGAIGGILGFGGGAAGTSFAGPQAANITNGVDVDKLNRSYSGNQGALAQQQLLLEALQGQNGIQNQSNVYGQLQGVVNGTGPNPAQAMLNQATGQNVANQSALMAGQRGAGSNVGLMARQAGQQGGALQQNAAGQAAVMQANQSLNALNAAGNMAGQQVSNQMAGTNAVTSAQQAEQAQLLNALANQNSAKVASQGSINSANAGLAGSQMAGTQQLIGGAMNALGGGASMMGGSGSGIAGGGEGMNGSFPTSAGGKMSGAALASGGQVGPQSALGKRLAGVAPQAASGGMVDVVVSPGEKIVPPEEVKKVAHGGKAEMKTVPGKAEVKGDSLKNDNVPAKLPAGTVVVKRSRANNDPEGFIREVLSKRGKKK